MVRLVSTADALIEVADIVLNSFDELSKLEYNKKGRKYKFVNNTFQRVREEDKHLIIYPEQLELKSAAVSSYYILSNINGGEILREYPDFCLSIVGVADQLEQNGWYESENSSIVHFKNARFNPMGSKDAAIAFLEKVTEDHIKKGFDLLTCSKLNFLHTDHHIGTKVEGHYMRYFINEYYGPEALNSPDVLVALKSFVHWGNIKGVLYKLDVPNVKISSELKKSFESYPDPLEDLKDGVYDRYPSGTSKFSLLRKTMDVLGEWNYSRLVPFPEEYSLDWLFSLCHDIESDPIKYHLRSAAKDLCDEPVNLSELSNKYAKDIKKLLIYISLVLNTFSDTGGDFLLQNSKIPKLTDSLIEENSAIYKKFLALVDSIDEYEGKSWDSDDIILRLRSNLGSDISLYDAIFEMKEKYIEDYE